MPLLLVYKCSLCEFYVNSQTYGGDGEGHMYAIDEHGSRIICKHPGEYFDVKRITGLFMAEATDIGKVGFVHYYFCFNCATKIDIDVERDNIVCTVCNSYNLKPVNNIVGKSCVKCGRGIIEQIICGIS